MQKNACSVDTANEKPLKGPTGKAHTHLTVRVARAVCMRAVSAPKVSRAEDEEKQQAAAAARIAFFHSSLLVPRARKIKSGLPVFRVHACLTLSFFFSSLLNSLLLQVEIDRLRAADFEEARLGLSSIVLPFTHCAALRGKKFITHSVDAVESSSRVSCKVI